MGEKNESPLELCSPAEKPTTPRRPWPILFSSKRSTDPRSCSFAVVGRRDLCSRVPEIPSVIRIQVWRFPRGAPTTSNSPGVKWVHESEKRLCQNTIYIPRPSYFESGRHTLERREHNTRIQLDERRRVHDRASNSDDSPRVSIYVELVPRLWTLGYPSSYLIYNVNTLPSPKGETVHSME